MTKQYMAVGHCGTTLHGLTHPRKDIMERMGRTSARKQYQDKKDGPSVHTGYIVGGEWFTVYEVKRMERKV